MKLSGRSDTPDACDGSPPPVTPSMRRRLFRRSAPPGRTTAPVTARTILAGIACRLVGAVLALLPVSGHAAPAPPPTVEFDSPYRVRLLGDGAIIGISGSFSWALPQSFEAMLAASPRVTTVLLDSPGGHLLPSLQVAAIIQRRGLDTVVTHACHSACTLAFLGGRQRLLSAEARLGFHQAHAPNVSPELANSLLRSAYENFAIPAPFVAHTLRTPPSELWFPDRDELRAARVVTGNPPPGLIPPDAVPVPRLSDLTRLLPNRSDADVISFTTALADLVRELQAASPEACWAFANDGAADLRAMLPAPTIDAIMTMQRQLADMPGRAAAPPAISHRQEALRDLVASVRASGQTPAFAGLRPGAAHDAFCASLRNLLDTALGLADPGRVATLRALLSSP